MLFSKVSPFTSLVNLSCGGLTIEQIEVKLRSTYRSCGKKVECMW